MAIAHVAQRISFGSSATATAHTVPVSSLPSVGNFLVLRVTCSGNRTISSITDPRSNTWTILAGTNNSTTGSAHIAVCKVTTAYQAGDNLTVNLSGSGFLACVGDEFSGLADSFSDQNVALASAGSVTAFDSGTTAALAQADELIVGHVGNFGADSAMTITNESGMTALGTVSSTSTVRTERGHYKVVAATTAVRYNGTFAAARTSVAQLVTLKGASGAAALDGVIAGQSTLAGNLTDNPAALLAGVIGGQSTLSGDLTPGATSAALAGVIGGISTLSADLTPAPAAQLAGIIAAQSGLSGTLFDPSSVVLPTLSAIGNVFIEIWAPTPPVAKWDQGVWGTSVWSSESWVDITPQSQNLRFGWGADDAAQGILTQVAANAWTVYTYDPDRLLDPANDDSPYFDALRPGTHMQVRYDDGTNERILKEGTIDSIAYSLQEQRGQIRIVDRIGKMAGAKIPAGTTGVPTTLYAAARYLLGVAGLSGEIWTDPAPVPDPPIGAAITEETSLWDWLNTIALDCMHGVYVVAHDIATVFDGKTGIRSVVKFVDFTATAVDNGLAIGGVLGIPIEDIQPVASREGVFSQAITFDDGAPTTPLTTTDLDSVNRFGVVPYKRDRPVPNGLLLGQTIVADRAGASLQYNLGTLRPVTSAQLLALFDAGMLEVAHVTGDSRSNGEDLIANPIDIDTFLLGMSFEANTATGWSATAISYITNIWWLTH